MWYWRRMEEIKWSEKVTNEQVLECIGENRTLCPSQEIEETTRPVENVAITKKGL